MDEICKELDEVKAAMAKLTAEYHAKTELSESLRKAHNEQLIKVQEAKMEIEKQIQELNAKREEISLARQMYEDLKSNLQQKELTLRHLSSTNDQLRNSCEEKVQKLEREKIEFVSALDEARAKIEDQERKSCAYREELEDLKGLLSVAQKKCTDAEERSKAPKELRQRDDMLLQLEEENKKVLEKLKWRNEQFKHLEEAHEKLQDQFRAGMNEWQVEKSKLLDGICSLQGKLEAQTRASEGLRSKLQMCNQALAHEESRRKLLEIQASETKICYENVAAEYEEAKSMIESLTVRRDEEIAALRASLAMKDTLFKEMEFVRAQLERENQELQGSLKEFQEAQINQAGSAASVTKLRQKLRNLEQTHKACSLTLKVKEAEWSSQSEKFQIDLDECRIELSSQDKHIKELKTELEDCHSSMALLQSQNEEVSMALMVLKSEISKPRLEFKAPDVEKEPCKEKIEEQIFLLTEQLEKKNSALVKAQLEIEQERKTIASLKKSIESSYSREQQYFLMQKDLERYKEMLEESYSCRDRLKEQASQKEASLREDLSKVSNALDKANCDLSEEKLKGSEMEFELQKWKSVAEKMKVAKQDAEPQLKNYQDNNHEIRKEMEAAIFAKMETEGTLEEVRERFHAVVEEKDRKINDLKGQIVVMEQEQESMGREMKAAILAKDEAEKTFMQEKENFVRITDEKDKRLDNFQRQVVFLEQESMRREMEASILAKSETEKTFKQEKESFLRIAEEKEKSLDLQSQIVIMAEEFIRRITEATILATLETEKAFIKEKESFLCIAEEKDGRIDDLQRQIVFMEEECVRREKEAAILVTVETEKAFNKDKESFLRIAEEKDERLDDLQRQIVLMEEACVRREKEVLATVESEKAFFIKQKESFIRLAEEKQKKISDLHQQILLLEQVEVTVNSKLAEKQFEITTLHEAWQKIAMDYTLAKLEIVFKSLSVTELEEEIDSLKQKLVLGEKAFSDMQQRAEQLEGELKMEYSDKVRVIDQLKGKMRSMVSTERMLEGQIAELKGQIKGLFEVNTKLVSEREELVDQMIGFCDQIGEFSGKDAELMKSLERIVQLPKNEEGPVKDCEEDELFRFNKDGNHIVSAKEMKEAIPNRRSPLKALNS
ncbi:uncharacterized protein At4g38062-like [Tasmannia lanceolata]|uniref:uncharacterized protein At4g38062-like n=1 Tax=Tasmannia lanceolata TaxID=3420 RepID=UPI0040639129